MSKTFKLIAQNIWSDIQIIVGIGFFAVDYYINFRFGFF